MKKYFLTSAAALVISMTFKAFVTEQLYHCLHISGGETDITALVTDPARCPLDDATHLIVHPEIKDGSPSDPECGWTYTRYDP